MVTGDSLFVGDVARPDLAVDKEEGARGLYESIKRLLALGDFAEVWPGHIGGSLCGGAGMSEKPGTTIGFERRFNRLASSPDEETFVRALTGNLAPQPPNFERIVALNSGPLLTESAPVDELLPAAVQARLEARGDPARRARHARLRRRPRPGVDQRDDGARRRGDAGRLGRRPRERGRRQRATPTPRPRRMALLLEAVGFRRISGLLAGGIASWRDAGLPVESTAAIDIPELADRLRRDEVRLLDVRDLDEWEEGHVEGSRHLPYHDLGKGVPDDLVNGGKPLAVACSVGNRSSIAVSLLRRAGVEDVIHVASGGVAELADEGIELVAKSRTEEKAALATLRRAGRRSSAG